MKKQALAAAIVASISMPTVADSLGIHAGIDYRYTDTSFSDGSALKEDSNLSGYIAFEHFIPIIPNAKVKYADLTNSDVDYNSSIANGILYYELFDNDLFEFDFGLAYSEIKTEIESSEESASLGQAYLAGKAHIPGTDISAFTEIIGGSLSDDQALDAEIGLAYHFNPDSLLLNFSVRAGYRYQEMEFKNVATTQTTDGVFAGLNIHF